MRITPQHYAVGAFALLTVASFWETGAPPPAVFLVVLAAALARHHPVPSELRRSEYDM